MKVAELLDADKRATLANKDDILKNASSEDDCVKRMHHFVDEFAMDFVDRDDFLKDVPQTEVDGLKKKLEASFRDSYRQALVTLTTIQVFFSCKHTVLEVYSQVAKPCWKILN